MMLTCLDLFSGIGGFAIGFKRAGIETKKFCEIDLFARRVLEKHWPSIPIHKDVRTLQVKRGEFDIICGGFPCQDISYAGKGKGLGGERSGLWWQFHRLISDGHPRYVVIENVSALRTRGLEVILGVFAALGYDAEWHCIPASAVGAPHQRDRIWIVAYSHSQRCDRERLLLREDTFRRFKRQMDEIARSDWWETEPNVGRVANGLPNGMDRLRALGNSIVPQIAEIIGLAIVEDAG